MAAARIHGRLLYTLVLLRLRLLAVPQLLCRKRDQRPAHLPHSVEQTGRPARNRPVRHAADLKGTHRTLSRRRNRRIRKLESSLRRQLRAGWIRSQFRYGRRTKNMQYAGSACNIRLFQRFQDRPATGKAVRRNRSESGGHLAVRCKRQAVRILHGVPRTDLRNTYRASVVGRLVVRPACDRNHETGKNHPLRKQSEAARIPSPDPRNQHRTSWYGHDPKPKRISRKGLPATCASNSP